MTPTMTLLVLIIPGVSICGQEQYQAVVDALADCKAVTDNTLCDAGSMNMVVIAPTRPGPSRGDMTPLPTRRSVKQELAIADVSMPTEVAISADAGP